VQEFALHSKVESNTTEPTSLIITHKARDFIISSATLKVITMKPGLSLLPLFLGASVAGGAYGFAFLPSRQYASYPANGGAADVNQKNAQQQYSPLFVRRSGAAPSVVVLSAETSGGTAKNASEVSHDELREYRNAMSISRTEGKTNGASDKVRRASVQGGGRRHYLPAQDPRFATVSNCNLPCVSSMPDSRST
jgi:hypothetical protein